MATKNIRVTQTSEVVQDGSLASVNYLLEDLDTSESTTGTQQVPSNATLTEVQALLDAKAEEYANREVWIEVINADISNPRTLAIEVPDPEV